MPEPTVWPALRYDDADAGLRFLTDVLGFREALVVRDEASGSIAHAELRWPEGGGVMLGSTRIDEGLNERMKPGTNSVYVVSDRVDAVHERCRAAGVEIVGPLEDTDYGSHTFTAADAEGNLWTIGSYRGAD